jgi:hypothetical protein
MQPGQPMRFLVALLLLGPSPFVWAAAEPSRLRVFHRLHHPLAAEAPFTERGTVTILDNNVLSFELSASFRDDFNTFAEALDTIDNASQQLLYQVALERPGDSVKTQWDISSVKAVSNPYMSLVRSRFLARFIPSAISRMHFQRPYTSILSIPTTPLHMPWTISSLLAPMMAPAPNSNSGAEQLHHSPRSPKTSTPR